MAVDHSSVPKDLRASAAPGRVHPPSYWDPTAPSPGGSSFFSAAADHPSPRKVKLLCSFGGRILPRPSDGTLRYAGGQTRIISLRKDVTFLDFAAKMAEAMGAAAVAVKYQLPGEDLDALISVSCPEDLVNMMEEYEKLAAASPDGSFKLRAFLFSPSELASVESVLHHGAIADAGQRYVEAINGFGVFDAARLRRDSVASATSSAQTSEGTGCGDAVEDVSGEGMSPSFPSHAVDSEHDASSLVYAGGSNPNMPSDGYVEIQDPAGVLAPGIGFPDQNPALARPDQSPMAPPFISPAHMDPHQLRCLTPQHPVAGGLQPINVAPLTMHSYVHGALPTPSNIMSPASQVNSLQKIQARFAPNLDNQYGGKVPQTAGDQNMKAFQPLSQLPPLPPKHLQPYLPQQQSPSRLEDCLMCQKALPHAHSDSLVQEHDVRSLDSLDKASSMFYSQRSEDITKYRAAPMATGALPNNIPDLSAESMSAVSQFPGPLFSHNPEGQPANLVNKAAIQSSAFEMMMPTGDGLSNQSLLGYTYVQGQFMNPWLQHQHLQQPLVWNALQPPQYLVKQEMVPGLPNDESLFSHQLQTGQPHKLMVRQEGVVDPSVSGSFKNVNFHNSEPTAHDFVRQFTDSSVLPMTSGMESLRLNPYGPSETFHQGVPALSQVDAPNYLVVENDHNARSQFRDNALFIGHDGVNCRFVPEGNYSKPMEQPSENIQLQSRKNVDATQAVNMTQNHDPYPHNLGMAIEGSVPYQNFLQMPVGFNNTNTIPAAGLPVDSSQLHSTAKHNDFTPSPGSIPLSSLSNSREHVENSHDQMPSDVGFSDQSPWEVLGHANMLPPKPSRIVSKESAVTNDFTPSPGSIPLSSLSNSREHVENSHDQMPSDVGFSDQSPWEVLGHANMLPPKPSRIVSKESAVTNDYSAANHFTNGSDIVAMLEEGNLHHPPHTVVKESRLEPINLTKVSEEERIKQQLQAVAEDVAAAVFQPFETFETTDLPTEADTETWSNKESTEVEKVAPDEEVEEFMDNKLDKEIPSIQLNEDMGHLQIIQNGDLEELQELGSGTFGTVFHGKWRGSDVAIKRINDRCFSAKKSEEERMRADFWNEARKLADLHHPNVVAFYGVVLDGPGGSIATVTEYMVNGSLRQALQRNAKAFDLRKRLVVAMDVAFGMEYLHAKNIIHFDIKSDNLLVNLRDPQRPICKVGDLGLSKVKCKTLISGGMRGTLPWMAPELLYGNDSLVSEKVDVFSFGVVMWEMLTGEEPYADLHYGAIIGGILSNTLRPTVPESCDPEWRSLMEHCWSAEPLERPSFTEIANKLRCMTAALAQKVQPQAHK